MTVQGRIVAAVARLRLSRFSAVGLWVLFMVTFGILEPATFLSATTFSIVFHQGVVPCLVALAFLVPLTAGAFDLSVGGLLALSLSLCVFLNIATDLPILFIAVIALLATSAVGALSGFIVVRLRIDSFIATLGVSQLLLAGSILISGNSQIIGHFPDFWAALGIDRFLGAPIIIFFLLAVSLLLWFIFEHTRIGRYLFATGGNAEAARLAGVPTDRMIWGSLIASGFIAGLGGIVLSMQFAVFAPTTGPGYLFPAVTAVFLGASQFQQRPNVWGTLVAYFALAFGIQGLTLAAPSASAWSQPLFQGAALILAVALASRHLRQLRRGRHPRKTDPPSVRRSPAKAALR